ncbi:TlpA family protein disulfide reductase [Halosolutus amylolyticus]|uniref:TlpA family protein disulfide reductase n=1 Tax=Halosolutus amylolyticus TaxID=2932267 RepID=A0ABD5PMU9_9EURY|nr:TlpA disulfide reductase family protein [Halosolutus amylolyticus]
MRRREALAGIASGGVIAAGGAIAILGLPSGEDLPGDFGSSDDGSYEVPDDPLAIETVDAPGSEAGEVLVPSPDRATFVDIFGTWCPPCIEQMPALAEAHDRIGDEVLFISVTNESVGEDRAITEAELVDWWDEHGGNWTLGLDPRAELTERYLDGGYPTAAAIDATGTVQWSGSGVKSADELVAGIEQALSAGEDGT